MPYDERPSSLPLDIEECRTALWVSRGNVSKAAQLLKIPSTRLRKFVQASPYLSAEVKEAAEQLIDIAEDVAYEALTCEDDAGRRDSMARFIMSGIGKTRGHGTGGGGSLNLNLPKGDIHITWGDGSDVTAKPNTIEHEAAE